VPVMKRTVLSAALVLLCTGAFGQAVPDSLWDGRLWLTSRAFGLEEDCPVRVLFQDPDLRSAPLAEGGEVASRLVSQSVRGGDLFLTIETARAGEMVERVVLQLRGHPSDGVVSVESIRMSGAQGGGERTLSYSDAVSDDEEYDLYTDTLVSLYKTFFDEQAVRARLAP
jgi:hypothetical protein